MSARARKGGIWRSAARAAGYTTAAGAAAAAYMVFESQWPLCRQLDLLVPGLPAPYSGLTVLHLSDVHAGFFPTNERSLAKVVRWVESLAPDLVLLTGDILGEPRRSATCLRLLSRLQPPLGMFAVNGNHEYGLGKGPFAHVRDTRRLWQEAGVTLLRDECVKLPARDGSSLVVCGADHLSGGLRLLEDAALLRSAEADPPAAPASALPEWGGPVATEAAAEPRVLFPILLIHRPPSAGSELASLFPLAFAGHTHGGQLRLPGPTGLTPIHREKSEYLDGVRPWGAGLMVVSRGVGSSFVPFRLFTRPEATLWRLVYTSNRPAAAADHLTHTGGIHG